MRYIGLLCVTSAFLAVALADSSLATATRHNTIRLAEATNTSVAPTQTFQQFLEKIRQEARAKGISEKTIQRYLTDIKAPQSISVYLVQHQAHREKTFAEYSSQFLSGIFFQIGQKKMSQYHAVLHNVSQQYGVPPGIIIAIWGIESSYGANKEKFSLIDSLVTLSYQNHRAAFFKEDLFNALQMLDTNYHIPEQTQSTPDGGMGLPSFQPTAYQHYAVDFDKDGFKNIWTSVPDTLASIANFLKQKGWTADQTWGIPVTTPHTILLSKTGLDQPHTAAQWKAMGVQWSNKENPLFPPTTTPTWLIYPDPTHSKTAFLVFPNFKVLRRWNPTIYETLTIGLLSDTLSGLRDKSVRMR